MGPKIDQLVREKEYEYAISLCESVADFDETAKVPRQGESVTLFFTNFCTLQSNKLKEIRKLFAYHLFAKGQYEQAMEFFFEVSADPLEVIGLYPHLLPKAMRDKYEYPMDIPMPGRLFDILQVV